MNGWIKLHRKIWENPIVTKDSEYLAVWIWLLTHAEHKEKYELWGGQKIKLSTGQLITGRKKIAKETGVNESKVKRILFDFKSDQQIDQQSNTQGSLITILAWNKYQIKDQQSDQRVTNERPTSDQQTTIKTDNKVTIVDNSPKQAKSTVAKGETRKSDQQIDQQEIVYDSQDAEKVTTIQEKQEYKNKRNQERYISPLVGQYIEYRERKKQQ